MDPYMAEVRIFAGTFAPKGWALCNGQTLPINQNQALFSLLGTTYGGDGRTTFQLPDLRGRLPMHASSSHTLGQAGGEATHLLTAAELPPHSHAPMGSSAAASSSSPAGSTWATTVAPHYGTQRQVAMAPTGQAGGSQAHENMPPYLAVTFIIALSGVFPSRS